MQLGMCEENTFAQNRGESNQPQGGVRTGLLQKGVTFERRQDEQEVGTGSQRNENRASRPGKGRVEKHRNVEDSSGWPVDPKAG